MIDQLGVTGQIEPVMVRGPVSEESVCVCDALVATPPGWTITGTPAFHPGRLTAGLFNPADAPRQSINHLSVVTSLPRNHCTDVSFEMR